jgi:hypothetical protein
LPPLRKEPCLKRFFHTVLWGSYNLQLVCNLHWGWTVAWRKSSILYYGDLMWFATDLLPPLRTEPCQERILVLLGGRNYRCQTGPLGPSRNNTYREISKPTSTLLHPSRFLREFWNILALGLHIKRVGSFARHRLHLTAAFMRECPQIFLFLCIISRW